MDRMDLAGKNNPFYKDEEEERE
jgi:hypothetical protein